MLLFTCFNSYSMLFWVCYALFLSCYISVWTNLDLIKFCVLFCVCAPVSFLCFLCKYADVSYQTFSDQEVIQACPHKFWQLQICWGRYGLQWLLQKSHNYHGKGCEIGYPWGHLHTCSVQGNDVDKAAESEWSCVLGDHKRIFLKC